MQKQTLSKLEQRYLDNLFVQACAKRRSNRTVLMLLDKGADINARSSRALYPGIGALHMAVLCGRNQLLKVLLKCGANPNVVDDSGVTPLILAATLGRNLAAKALIRAGADVQAKDRYGRTALHYSCRIDEVVEGGHISRALINCGADVNIRDNDGIPPILEVNFAGYGCYNSVHALLSADVDLHVTTPEGLSLSSVDGLHKKVGGLENVYRHSCPTSSPRTLPLSQHLVEIRERIRDQENAPVRNGCPILERFT